MLKEKTKAKTRAIKLIIMVVKSMVAMPNLFFSSSQSKDKKLEISFILKRSIHKYSKTKKRQSTKELLNPVRNSSNLENSLFIYR